MCTDDGSGEVQRFQIRVRVDQGSSEFAVFDRRAREHNAVGDRRLFDRCVFEDLDVLAELDVRKLGAWVDMGVAVESPGDGV